MGDIYGMLVDVVSRRQVQSMDDNCGEWVKSMGVALGVVSRKLV